MTTTPMTDHITPQPSPDLGPVEPAYSIRVSPRVLTTIVRLSALDVPGVADLSTRRNGKRGGRGVPPNGVRAELRDGAVWVEVALIVERTASMREVSSAVQRLVAEAIETMLALPVAEVNVYVEDVR